MLKRWQKKYFYKFCTQKVHTQGLDNICNSDLSGSDCEK